MSGESKTSARRTEAKLRMNRVLTMRKAGATYEAIAEKLGFKDKTGAYRAYQRAMKTLIQEPADELRQLELARLDDMHMSLWAKAAGGALGAVDRILKIMERRAKLTGMDLPTLLKSELTGPGGGPIQTSEALDLDLLTVEELVLLKALMEKARKKVPDAGGP